MIRPEHIEWALCSCGHASCERQYPINLGTFLQGTGFEPHEVKWLNEAWENASQFRMRRNAYRKTTTQLEKQLKQAHATIAQLKRAER